jgi:hypothetical protein
MRGPARAALRGACAATALVACTGAAQTHSVAKEPGARLLERCELAQRVLHTGGQGALTAGQYADAQTCLAFVDGFLWGHGWAVWRTNRDMYYCPPEELSAAQAIPMIVDYLRAHPERLETDAHVLTFSALSYAFPCQPVMEAPRMEK